LGGFGIREGGRDNIKGRGDMGGRFRGYIYNIYIGLAVGWGGFRDYGDNRIYIYIIWD